MEENTPSISTLHDLMDYDARRFTTAEVQLSMILEEWTAKAGSLQLKNVLQKYLDFVKQHLQKSEAFFEAEQISSFSTSNRIMKAFIEETEEKMNLCSDQEVKDACLLAAVQSINHFKISVYGTAAAYAQALGMEKEAAVFHEAGINEKQIDDRLSQLAEYEINRKARTPIVLPSNN